MINTSDGSWKSSASFVEPTQSAVIKRSREISFKIPTTLNTIYLSPSPPPPPQKNWFLQPAAMKCLYMVPGMTGSGSCRKYCFSTPVTSWTPHSSKVSNTLPASKERYQYIGIRQHEKSNIMNYNSFSNHKSLWIFRQIWYLDQRKFSVFSLSTAHHSHDKLLPSRGHLEWSKIFHRIGYDIVNHNHTKFLKFNWCISCFLKSGASVVTLIIWHKFSA